MKELLKKNLDEVITAYPTALALLQNRGEGVPVESEAFSKITPYLSLEKALERWNINKDLFLKELEAQNPADEANTYYNLSRRMPPFVALLPCGLRNPFNTLLETFLKQEERVIPALIEGNVNHELSFYEHVSQVEKLEDLPDFMITSDINPLFHTRFQERFVNAGSFMQALEVKNPIFLEAGMKDPENLYTFMTTNLLVVVADLDKLEGRAEPETWKDLLSREFRGSIGARGEEDFFCHAITLPYYLLYGETGIRELAQNIEGRYHPSEMVKLCNNPRKDSPALFIMPWFFARKIVRKNRTKIIFPREGAFASPVSFFIKKDKVETYKSLLHFLTGPEMGKLCEELCFPVAFAEESPNFPQNGRIFWIGWDIVRSKDLSQVKKEIDELLEGYLPWKQKP
ncbi:MAG: ABC transporter substrate-binding protein [Sphaerochaetaceae bacterium]